MDKFQIPKTAEEARQAIMILLTCTSRIGYIKRLLFGIKIRIMVTRMIWVGIMMRDRWRTYRVQINIHVLL